MTSLGVLTGILQAESDQLDAAIQTVADLEPNLLTAAVLASMLDAAERYDEVIDMTDGLSNDDDLTALLIAYRGRAFRATGHPTAARETLREALKSKKRESAVLHLALVERAYAYLDEGKKAQAKKDAERLLAEDRSHPELEPLLAVLEA